VKITLSQKQKVIQKLTEEILSGKRAGGSPLRELTIAKELGTSQGPVREALRELQGLGYVTYKPRCGCSVTQFSEEYLLETYDVREALELFAVKKCVPLLISDNNKKREFEEIFTNLMNSTTLIEFSENDLVFHRFIISSVNSPLFDEQWNRVINRSQVAALLLQKNYSVDKAVAAHKNLGTQLLAGNITQSLSEVETHYQSLRKIIQSNEKRG